MRNALFLGCVLFLIGVIFVYPTLAGNSNVKLSTKWGEIRSGSIIKAAPSATQTRPIEEFIEAQGTYLPSMPNHYYVC